MEDMEWSGYRIGAGYVKRGPVSGCWFLVAVSRFSFLVGGGREGMGWRDKLGWADLGFGSFLNILIAEALEFQESF
jgi:hypothetical protein